MSLSQQFLRDVQRAGFIVVGADAKGCVGRCGAPGCKLRVKLREGAAIPQRAAITNILGVPLTSFDNARRVLRQRRKDLHLSIAEVEEVAGMTPDRLAKCERDEWTKQPNVQTFIEWAGALGFDVVLQPAAMPPLMLSTIVQTRALVASRSRLHERERAAQSPRG